MIERIELPEKIVPLFAEARGTYDYRGSFGGRSSAKSASFASMGAIFGMIEPLRIVCARELQVSIKESFHAELKRSIERYPFLRDHYDVGVDYIRGSNGTEFIFRGLRHNMSAIKSMADIGLAIVEEAEDVSESSWEDLTGTIREPNAEIWPIWNPKSENSPVHQRFRASPPERSMIVELNYKDNPWFSERSQREMEYDRKRDFAKYLWKWEGQFLKNDNSRVFSNWKVEEFETNEASLFRLGADWGFSQDPSVLIRCYIDGRRLYIDYEAYMIGCEIDQLPDLFSRVPDSEKYFMTADSARPETISYMRKHGYPKINSAIKGAKSVIEGIEFLKSYDIIVHPRCKHTIDELTMYSFKLDPLTSEVTNILEDKHNHVIDALRYALEGARKASKKHEYTYVPSTSTVFAG